MWERVSPDKLLDASRSILENNSICMVFPPNLS